ncbi:DUF2865 domain-containing protein [Methylocystis sp. IM3]|jgi:hypothetical protein|uniref:DUF2865 domain-containing protein n=1 Tax=unclassified Methylocystis TaxID=2625913 RepID=UPI000FAA2DBC|nr:MAG: DUF2865 domain-containing protein [Hyphomicrobiales bacterium]
MRDRLAVFLALGLALSFAPAPGAAQGLLEFLFGPDPTPQQAAPRPRESAPSRRAGAPGSGGARPGAGFASDPGAGGFCVRTCDGYFFPLIKSTRATRQQSCQLACPSAAMDVYDGSTIESARNRKGQRYSALPRAFAFRDKASGDCVCNDPGSAEAYSERASKDDPTLQNGDILVETDGAFVYSGSKLVPLGEAAVSSNLRNRLRAMLRRSPMTPPVLTGTIAPAPPALEISKDDQAGVAAARQAAP